MSNKEKNKIIHTKSRNMPKITNFLIMLLANKNESLIHLDLMYAKICLLKEGVMVIHKKYMFHLEVKWQS